MASAAHAQVSDSALASTPTWVLLSPSSGCTNGIRKLSALRSKNTMPKLMLSRATSITWYAVPEPTPDPCRSVIDPPRCPDAQTKKVTESRPTYSLPVERQLPSTYCVRTEATYGTGHTTARISTCLWLSTVGFFEPPASSPQTTTTSGPLGVPGSSTA
jgi:hypothetical protein